ncbi:acetyl-CoA-benzylalcohol acetyltransferase [Salix suchowensis]|nr:acetyl-CoA-benzylalcohol acetyltransferase [Salix suchowensis]
MRVAIVSRKFITPSSSTPPHLRSCEISALDQLIPPVYGGFTCFYPADGNIQGAKHSERRKQLEESLSKILTLYYPAAGRYVEEKLLVDCNDKGVEFLEADVSGRLSQILNGELQPEELNQLLPYPVPSPTTPLVAVQISTFKCGGMAVGLRVSHKIFDIAALTSFFNGWATTCRAGIDEVPRPSFALPSLFPTRETAQILNPTPVKNGARLVTRTFVFSRSAVASLQVIARTGDDDLEGGKGQPSRVQVVTAIIWKALIKVAKLKHGFLRPSALIHGVEMRKRSALPTPPNCFGNMLRLAMARFEPDESKTGLRDLVITVRKAIRDAVIDCRDAMSYDELFARAAESFRGWNEEARKGEIDLYTFSSWCGFPVYEVDFGWGKPAWVSSPHKPVPVVNLLDTKDGGVAVWMTAEEMDMILFQRDPEIVDLTSTSH